MFVIVVASIHTYGALLLRRVKPLQQEEMRFIVELAANEITIALLR